MTRKERSGIIILLGALSALGPFSIDMYLPGFPSIAASLKTSVAVVGYSLTSYFIGISLGQLIYGPLTDRFGRKIPLLVGLGLYLVAAAACALSPSIAWLVITRFLMALGVCVGMVASRAIVRDLFPVNEIAGVFSAFMLIIAVSPMLAPSAGGFVASHLGWRFIFVILVIFAAILIVTVALLLSESKRPDPMVSMRPGSIIAQYITVAKNRQFLVYAIVSGLGSAGLFAYISDSSYVFMQLFGLSQAQFGWAFSLNAAGLIIGSQVNRFLLRKFNSRQITGVCVRAQVIIGAVLVAGAVLNLTPMGGMIALLIAFLFFTGILNPNAAALALEPFTSHAGSASALLGSIQMALGAIASGVVSSLVHHNAIPMAATMWSSALLGVGLLALMRRAERAEGTQAAG